MITLLDKVNSNGEFETSRASQTTLRSWTTAELGSNPQYVEL